MCYNTEMPGPPPLKWQYLMDHYDDDTDECIEMDSGSARYPRVAVEGRVELAHRLSCRMAYGPPPSDKPYALHSCNNTRCINSRHLRWGSHADNVADYMATPEFYEKSSRTRKLSDADVRDIVSAPRKWGGNIKMAERYGVTVEYIARLRSGCTPRVQRS